MKKILALASFVMIFPQLSLANSLCREGTLQFAVNHQAAKLADVFKAGENPNCLSDKGTPLLVKSFMWSADAHTVKTILDHGGDVNVADKAGQTALHLASYLDAVETIHILMNYKANIEAKTSTGRTPLFVASQGSSLNALKTLIELGANLNVVETESTHVCLGDGWSNYAYIKRTPMIAAILTAKDSGCQRSSFGPDEPRVIETLQLLLAAGADVNKNTDTSALGVASYFNSVKIVQLLLANGADVNSAKPLDYKPYANYMHYLIGLSDMGIIELALAKNPILDGVSTDGDSLYHAAIFRKPANQQETMALIERLFKSIPQLIDQADSKGFTPLMVASNSSVELLKTLIRLGADPKKVDDIGRNADCFTFENSEQDKFYLDMGVKCGIPR